MMKLKKVTMITAMLISVLSWAVQAEPAKQVPVSAQSEVQLETEKATAPLQTININSATAKQLAKLNSIGLKKAQQIIEYRKLHGQFSSVDDLAKVKGIGKSTIEKNRLRMVVAVQ